MISYHRRYHKWLHTIDEIIIVTSYHRLIIIVAVVISYHSTTDDITTAVVNLDSKHGAKIAIHMHTAGALKGLRLRPAHRWTFELVDLHWDVLQATTHMIKDTYQTNNERECKAITAVQAEYMPCWRPCKCNCCLKLSVSTYYQYGYAHATYYTRNVQELGQIAFKKLCH